MFLKVFMVSTPSIRFLRGPNGNFRARHILKRNSVPRRPWRSPFRSLRRDINTEASVRQREREKCPVVHRMISTRKMALIRIVAVARVLADPR